MVFKSWNSSGHFFFLILFLFSGKRLIPFNTNNRCRSFTASWASLAIGSFNEHVNKIAWGPGWLATLWLLWCQFSGFEIKWIFLLPNAIYDGSLAHRLLLTAFDPVRTLVTGSKPFTDAKTSFLITLKHHCSVAQAPKSLFVFWGFIYFGSFSCDCMVRCFSILYRRVPFCTSACFHMYTV